MIAASHRCQCARDRPARRNFSWAARWRRYL